MEISIRNQMIELAQMMSESHSINILKKDSMMDLYQAGINGSSRAYDSFIESLVAYDTSLNSEEMAEATEYITNSLSEFMTEATSSQDVAVYAGFQPMLLRETFSRRIARKLVTTEVTTELSPTYGVFKTSFIDKDGTEITLAELTTDTQVALGWYVEEVTLGTPFNAFTKLTGEDVAVANKLLDLDFKIVVAKFTAGDVKTDITTGYDGTIKGTVVYTPANGTPPTTEVIHGFVDFKTGDVILHAVGTAVAKVNVRFRLSNTFSEVNSFEARLSYVPTTVRIGDGELINFGIPMNFLNDIKAFENTDGMAKAVEAVSATHTILTDREILVLANDTADMNANNVIPWSKAVPAGTSVIDHNTSLLFAINSGIAIADNNTQFGSIRQFNIACNPIDANIVTSPVVLRQAVDQANASVVAGNFNYSTSNIVSNAGNVNLLSTKLQAQGAMVVVPKSDIKEEKVICEYRHSNTFYGDNSYRNPKYPNIKTIATRERKTIKVHETEAVTKIEITA